MSKDKMTPEELNKKGVKLYNEDNYEEAVKLFRLAAEKGYARAQCNLGVCYEYGRGVEQSYEEAVKLYKLAAEQGNAIAQCNLGYCYKISQGVEKS